MRWTLWKVGMGVLLFHLFILLFFSWQTSSPKPLQPAKLLVHTVVLEPSKQAVPVRKERKTMASKPAENKKGLDAKKRQLLAHARDQIAKIGKKGDNSCPKEEGSFVAMIDQLAVESTAVDYRAVLSSFLRRSLRLPEEGEVTVTLTLSKSGQVLSFNVEEARSCRNRQYVEANLPQLRFPPFGDASKKTLTLTLSHDL